MARIYFRLGEMLIKEGLLTQEQLEKAIMVQRREGGRIGEVLVRLGLVKEEEMLRLLSKQINIPFAHELELLNPALDENLEQLIPHDFALKNLVLPLSRNLNSLTCAIFDPLDVMLIDNLRKITGCDINPVLSTRTNIIKAIERFYGKSNMLKDVVKESYGIGEIAPVQTREDAMDSLSLDKLIARAEEATVVKLVDLIVRQAIDERASDIHIEPFKDRICLRYRIDGKLYEIPPPARHLHVPIVSRIKIISKLDIAEKRLPQDGSFTVKMEDREIDLRVSIVPTIYGERVVLRILDRSQAILDLDKLGFMQQELEILRRSFHSAYGLIFLTGPTGSGKTTTLYAALNEIKSPTKNIITIEDPVEYKLEGINQVQVKPEIGLSFASALRSFLRQDPDIILVGEVRDLETAEICIRSALTGHLVLSTLHTNDAPSAITRLVDIGVAPFLLVPSLLMVLAQRLVRKLCPNCKEASEPKPEELSGISLKTGLIYRPKGCPECNQIGYRGRSVIAEVMIINDKMRQLISKNASIDEIKELARKQGMHTLQESGIKKVEDGITSLSEVLGLTLGE